MNVEEDDYLHHAHRPLKAVLIGLDKDVERSQKLIMQGYMMVMGAPLLAPVMPPHWLLPLMALIFILAVTFTRQNFLLMQVRLRNSLRFCNEQETQILQPVIRQFLNYDFNSLTTEFNPIKNFSRLLKSLLGSLLINPLWLPIFYGMGVHIREDKFVFLQHKSIVEVQNIIDGK